MENSSFTNIAPNKPKVYFLGSGPIAVPVLKMLSTAPELDFIGVGTQLDRPAGRNRKPTPTPVGVAAVELGIEPDRIESVNTATFLDALAAKAPDIVLVLSFGQILRKDLLALPRCGCVNIHASLLPRYRGASPITQCILNRDAETGVCFMAMERGLDTGAVYHTIPVALDHSEYADSLEFKLGHIAAAATPGILCSIFEGLIAPIPQDSIEATICTKIRKSDGRIDWTRSALEIEAMVRAYYPWPGASATVRTSRGEGPVTLLRVNHRRDLAGSPGEVLQSDKYALIVACRKGAVEIVELAPPGRKAMSAVDYVNGLRGEKIEFLP